MAGLKHVSILAASVTVGMGCLGMNPVKAATLLDFEGAGADGGEALSASAATNGYTIGTFGATTGTHALNFLNHAAGSGLTDIGTVTAGSTGAGLANYNAIIAGLGEAGAKSISFDFSLDTTKVTTNSYYQFGISGNSNNGYFQLGYGNLINGYDLLNGLSLGGPAVAEGVTLEALDPYNPSAGDRIGTYRVTIPLFPASANTDGNHPTYGGTDYFQFGFNEGGGYGGTADFAIDNVQIGVPVNSAPEPASLGLLGLLGGTVLARRRN